jgi:predicted nucleic-acid-binding protein
MIGLDTNILVRYLAQDDPIQSPRAEDILGRLTEASPGFVSVVAMAETAWVLERSHGLNNHEIAEAVERILHVGTLVVENEQAVFTAIVLLKAGRGSFADALIGALGARAGCSRTLTFDRKAAARLPDFVLA